MEPAEAVFVRGAYKNYGKKEILKNFCMRVQRGSIYGLLGASGCGKTTLLSCIVGLKTFDAGELWVLGGKPGTVGSGIPGPRVGYMPQDIALVGEFTVKEAVFYFGRIFNMAEKVIEERFQLLSKLLELPPSKRFIKNCSGGQQRRVSFAAAMVHSPDLLILDEPTVGLDPVLRESIWTHLVELTQKGKVAVIITTHYIEEARQANTIGLMRQGRLLAEESPARLLALFQTESLEEVFLTLSQRQESGAFNHADFHNVPDEQNNSVLPMNSSMDSIAMSNLDHASTDVLTTKKKKKKEKRVTGLGLNKNRLRALLQKNWKQFIRNLGGIAFLLIFPVIEIAAFLMAVGGDIKNIPLAIVNYEQMTYPCNMTSFNGTAEPYSFSSCHFTNISCRFLKELDDPMINPIYYHSLTDATEAVKHGDAVGVLYMADNFTEAYENRFNDGSSAQDVDLEFGEIKVWMDMSNRQIGQTIKYKLYKLFYDFQEKLFVDCNYLEKFAKIPVRIKGVYGDEDESYTVFMTPGMMLTIMFFLSTTMTSTIIITDRLEGVWDRSIVAGVTSLEILLTHLAIQVMVVVLQMTELIIVVFGIARMEVIGNIATIALIVAIQGVCGMSYGLWVSVVSSTHFMANIISTGSFYPMILICGLVWPLEGMPAGLQFISRCMPFTISIEALRNVMKKGWSITHWEVLNGIGIGIIWFFIFSIISILMLRSKR